MNEVMRDGGVTFDSDVELEQLWERRQREWPLPGPEFEIHPGETALVVVDVQQFNCVRGVGLAGHLEAQAPELADYYYSRLESIVIPNIRRLVETARSSGVRIVYHTVGSELPDGSDTVPARRNRTRIIESTGQRYGFAKGSPEHAIVDDLAPIEGELVLNKTSRSPFTTTGFDQSMRNLGIRTLVMVGVLTDACVHITAADASDRGYNVAVVADASATFAPWAHDWALADMSVRYARIITVDGLLNVLRARSQGELSRVVG